MTDHVRTQIRDALMTTVGNLTTTGGNVFGSRVYPLDEDSLPALIVRTVAERCAPLTTDAPAMLQRTVVFEVIGVAQATADLESVLDTIAAEVEDAVAGGGLPAGAKYVRLTGTEFTLSGEGERPTGQAALSYEVSYVTAEDAPTVAL